MGNLKPRRLLAAKLVEAVSGGKAMGMYIGIGTVVVILLIVILVMALRGRGSRL